jgi:GTP cyclohydrolase I
MHLHEHHHWDTAAIDNDQFTEHDWRRLLAHLGENPDRQGLLETPKRVEKAWQHWTSGYAQNPADLLKVFEDGAEQYDELIVVRGIPVYSHCEHHLAPFFGTATIGYKPDGKIVGLSKLTRLVDMFAKRLQVQERLTMQIADALMTHLAPRSVGVIVRCRHMCMESRGIQVAGEQTVTSALFGDLRTDPAQRAEFLAMARDKN